MSPLKSRIKFLGKRVLWDLPAPLSRAAVSFACATGVLSRSYLAYQKLGRPESVLSGPFVGMGYIPIALGSAWMPKILGTYEKELWPAWDRLREEPCDVLVDIGSAEGYYAVGLAGAFDIPRVHAYDPDPVAASTLPGLAALNGVADRVTLGGFCHAADLEAILKDANHPLVVCDCEGGEADLLDPDASPSLGRARVVVEVHDYFGADAIGSALRQRFAATHEVTTVPVRPRSLDDLPDAVRGRLTDPEALAALSEARPPVAGWLLLWPKAPAAGVGTNGTAAPPATD